MTKRNLPQHPHIEYLRKEAKQRFALLKQRATGARLADAQYGLAQEYGFSNWRMLKDEVLLRMGRVRIAPLRAVNTRRFRPIPASVDDDLEADGYFQRGAATLGIGAIIGVAIIAVILLLFAGRALGQTAKADTSPHTTQMVATADGTGLEVLDWGGSGRPLVFLAGLGATAHDFDAFARASGKPAPDGTNYDAAGLGGDVLAVIEALKLDRPVLAGHSLAGEELSWAASRHPEKLAGVIYLDAGYALAYYAPGNLNPVNANLTMDLNALRRKVRALASLWQKPREGVAAIDLLLKSDMRQLEADLKAARTALRDLPPAPPMPPMPPGAAQSPQANQSPQAKINAAIQDGAEKFGALEIPVLAIFAAPHAPPPNAPSPAMLEYFKAVDKAGNDGLVARYKAGNPAAKVVVISNAQHAVFKSHPDDVAREMDVFLAGLR